MLDSVTSFAFVDLFSELLGDSPFEIVLNGGLMAIIAYVAYRLLLEPVYTAFKGMVTFFKLRNAKAAFLEITPPVQIDKSPLATQHLVTILQQLIYSHAHFGRKASGVTNIAKLKPDLSKAYDSARYRAM